MLNAEQIRVLKFYEGDVEDSNDPFWSDPKAYTTWNALLFSTTDSEKARTKEGRILNPSFLKDPERIIVVTQILLSCMSYADHDIHARRVERFSDYQSFLKADRFESFISTSTAGFLENYQDKEGLVFMEVKIPKGSLCTDLSKVLDSYRKKGEKEILLSPYASFSRKEMKMDPSFAKITDINGDPVKIYCEVEVGKYMRKEYLKVSLCSEMIDASIRFYEDLNHHRRPDEKDERMYLAYKHYIQSKVQDGMRRYE